MKTKKKKKSSNKTKFCGAFLEICFLNYINAIDNREIIVNKSIDGNNVTAVLPSATLLGGVTDGVDVMPPVLPLLFSVDVGGAGVVSGSH